jgi:hypothetical protein
MPGFCRSAAATRYCFEPTPPSDPRPAWVPDGALPLRFECEVAPLPAWAAELFSISKRIENPHTGTTQFYTQGEVSIDLPAGRYTLRVFKGIEYEVVQSELEIRPGETRALDVELVRWTDMPARGWYRRRSDRSSRDLHRVRELLARIGDAGIG